MKSECTDNCKLKKMHIENENNKLRREYKLMEESKHNMEKQNRIYEQEVKGFIVKIVELGIVRKFRKVFTLFLNYVIYGQFLGF